VICLLILLCLQIYIIAAAHSTDYVERSKRDFLAIWADQKANVERISLIEQKVSYTLVGVLKIYRRYKKYTYINQYRDKKK